RGGNNAVDTELFTKVPRFLTVRTAPTTWRLGILGNAEDRLVVGLDCSERFAELTRLRNGFLLALAPALALIAVGGWMVAGRAVRPLRVIAQAAEQMTAQGLDQRIPASGDDPEIQRLITVLNRMMDRLQASFQQANRFSADASHELKTPLAVMQAELEQALQNASDGSRDQQVFSSLLEETHRLARITRSLLLLARADSGSLALNPSTFDLGEDLDLIIMDARILAEAAGVHIESRIPPGVRVRADRVLLRQAIANLLDNAVHYNRPGGWVEIQLEPSRTTLELTISNTGPGIPTEDRSRIFDRFHRGAEARARRGSGAGLGLSLAREILVAHRGTLILAESTAARTVFRVSIPTSLDGREILPSTAS
ncbi:MAG: HAMP domain-containing protein, partial [Verrucomicrobiales bacterium]|nr:HAMP domain-containing protein [Verrucomicrobiales bacterium]